MAKSAVKYACTNCGAFYSSWAGRCTQCGEWNTIQEEIQTIAVHGAASVGRKIIPQAIDASRHKDDLRIVTHFAEIDEVLGGGIVEGSVVLLAGQPGIGKSTLLMQLAGSISKNARVLYVSGEESEHQVAMRAARLGVGGDSLQLAASSSADDIAVTIQAKEFDLVIVDSIQTMTVDAVSSAPGSVSQITNSTNLLLASAKKSNVALVVVGHVTKEGSIAGPKVLEHIVDVVMQLEGDSFGGFKLLRANKNRFGPTNEAALLEMTEKGLNPVKNPSAALLEERQITDGSVVLATIEGTKPLLVEVQALVNKTSYGYPKRASSGLDLTRLNLLIAMLERRTKLNLSEYDIYINIVGGIKLKDPAADLAVCLAIGSAAKGMTLKKNAAVFGEVGLSGEVRHVGYAEKRISEAKKMGFEIAIGPKQLAAKKSSFLHEVKDVRQALNEFLQAD